MTRRSLKILAILVFAAATTPAFAQKVVIERQGEASKAATSHVLTAEAVEKYIGKPPSGRAQVVFFRSSKSPGENVAVRDAAGGQPLIELEPGTYFIATTMPGSHAYATPDK